MRVCFFLVLAVSLISCVTKRENKETPNSSQLSVSSDSDNIQKAIDSIPKEGGTVFLKAKTYFLDKGLTISRSNIKLVGEKGTRLKLKLNVNQPVILIGSDTQTPEQKVEDIIISDLELDGSKEIQSSETDPSRPWIRNNGIDIRNANRVWLDNLNIYNARSGGLVISWGCRNLFINNSIFHNNEFDGIALYDSEDVIVKGFFSFENKSAGISLDNNLKHISFSSGSVKNNGDVGIFARSSTDLKFDNILIANNKSSGCFFSNDVSFPFDTGVKRSFFSSCSFLDNGGWGFWMAASADSSPDNTIVSSVFAGNALGAIEIIEGGTLELSGNVTIPPRPAKK